MITTRRCLSRPLLALMGALAVSASSPAPASEPALPERPVPCDKPAYLVVIATITDPEKSRAYVNALRAAGLYPALDGFYITSGKSAEVLEGKVLKDSPIVVAKFPCAEAARRFWYSDVYQKKILPLRAGAGTFEVAIFEERIDAMRP